MSILIFIVILLILILVHELGHFAVAKWVGMRVDEFGIGFPPKLFGKKIGETEYTINALPIGGFVRIYGEDGLTDPSMRSGASENVLEKNHTHQGDMTRSFTSKSPWAQAVVLVAGVTMNILFAWLLIFIAFGMGVRGAVSEEEASKDASLVITQVLKGSPAEEAGLTLGSNIESVSAEGVMLTPLTPSGFTNFVRTHAETGVTIAYSTQGELKLVEISPKQGVIDANPGQFAVGISLTLVDTISRNLGEAILDSIQYVAASTYEIAAGLFSLIRDAITMNADLSQVAGPVGIVGLVGDASSHGITTLLMFTAFISLNLAVINIAPFPALDGGRLVLVFIETLKGSPLNVRFVNALNTVGFFALMLLMIAVTWNDIARLL